MGVPLLQVPGSFVDDMIGMLGDNPKTGAFSFALYFKVHTCHFQPSRKEMDHLPTMHFQGLWLLVSGRAIYHKNKLQMKVNIPVPWRLVIN